jgi:hypothetical protein
MTEQRLVIFGFEYYNEVDREGNPIPIMRFRCQFPSGAQDQPTWPADPEDQAFLRDFLDRYELKILDKLDPNAQPDFVPEGLDGSFKPDKERE